MVINLILSMGVVSYFLFCGLTVWLVLVQDKEPTKLLGKVIKWHGIAVVVVLILTAVFTLSILFAGWVNSAIAIGGF